MSNPHSPENQPQPLRRESAHIPENLSDERLGDLLSGIGNHEGKALLLLAMDKASPDEVYFAQGELHSLITNLPGADNFDNRSRRNQVEWCQKSMSPADLVIKADYSPTRYALTQDGRRLGKPLAVLLLDFSDRFDTALLDIFGWSNTSTASRSPLNRLKLIREILVSPDMPSLIALKQRTGMFSNLETHLHALSRKGLVEYQSWDMTSDKVFELIDSQYQPNHHSADILRQKVLNYFKAHNNQASIDELLEYCKAELSAEAITIPSQQKFYSKIYNYVYALQKQGHVRAIGGRVHNAPIDLKLTDRQRIIWSELLSSLDRFQMQEPAYLEELNQKAEDFIRSKIKVTKALSRAAESSSRMQYGPQKNIGQLILSVLSPDNQPLTVRTIADKIKSQEGRVVATGGIRKSLYTLQSIGEIADVKDGKVKMYRRVDKSTSIN